MQTSSPQIEGSGAQPMLQPSQVKLSRASALAKSGDYEAALVVLLQMDPTPASLDLRARIEVQRGHYADARSLWREVLELAPGHPGAKKGLVSVQRAALRDLLVRRAVLAALLLGAASLAYLVLRPSPEQPAKAHVQPEHEPQPAAAVRPAPQPQPSAARPAPQPQSKPQSLAAARPAAQAAVPPKAALPELAALPGITLRREPNAQVYSFDGGLFSEGVAFVSGGANRVTALGNALAPYSASIHLELIGYVDTLPRPVERKFADNTALALSRANVVSGRLTRTTPFPADKVNLRAVANKLGPASSEQGDPRNRTVEIRVTLRD